MREEITMLAGIYISIIYTPNLGLGIAVSVREREQGRFRESIEGALGEYYRGAAPRHSLGEPELATSYPAIAVHVVNYNNNICVTLLPWLSLLLPRLIII